MLGVIMFQVRSDDDCIMGGYARFTSQLDPLRAGPSDFLPVAFVLNEFMITDMHHEMAAVGITKAN